MNVDRAIDLKFPPELMKALDKLGRAFDKVDSALSKVDELPRLLQEVAAAAWWDGFWTGALASASLLLSAAVLVLLARSR
jgi:hypothetical protein